MPLAHYTNLSHKSTWGDPQQYWLPNFTQKELIDAGIQNISLISSGVFSPKLEIKYINGEQINHVISSRDSENIMPLIESIIKNNQYKPKKIKRIYSDIDPYGEEDWES